MKEKRPVTSQYLCTRYLQSWWQWTPPDLLQEERRSWYNSDLVTTIVQEPQALMHLTMDQYHLELSCVSLAPRPKQPQRQPVRITSSISCEILEAICAGVVWVWEWECAAIWNKNLWMPSWLCAPGSLKQASKRLSQILTSNVGQEDKFAYLLTASPKNSLHVGSESFTFFVGVESRYSSKNWSNEGFRYLYNYVREWNHVLVTSAGQMLKSLYRTKNWWTENFLSPFLVLSMTCNNK